MKFKSLLIITAIALGCAGQEKREHFKTQYFYSFNTESANIFVTNPRGTLDKYDIRDSIVTVDYAQITDLQPIDDLDSIFRLELSTNEMILRQFEMDEVESLPDIYLGFWEYKDDDGYFYRKKFIPGSFDLSYESSNYDIGVFNTPNFFETYYKSFFNRFHFLSIRSMKDEVYLITNTKQNEITALKFNDMRGKKQMFSRGFPQRTVVGTWELIPNDGLDSGLFSSFLLFRNNEGVINEGYYKNTPLYYFVSPFEERVFIVVRSDDLEHDLDIFEMVIDSSRRNVLYSDKLVRGLRIHYKKKE